jgi:ribosomal 50S subunit-associated protein YjgA (DUF615 family)
VARKKFQWSRDGDEPEGEGEVHFTPRIPRNDMRRTKSRINALAKGLVKMKTEQLRAMALPGDVAEVVEEARRLVKKGNVKGGMKRQMLFVSAVIRGIDETELDRLCGEMDRLLGR